MELHWLEKGQRQQGGLSQAFPFVNESGHIIALVGAGGKTTLMYALATAFQRQGRRVAVTTTTHIFRPEGECFCCSLEECRARWKQGRFAVWARDLGTGKLGALSAEEFSSLCAAADTVLIEADGAKRLACKVPASHEPVIPAEADTVIAVVGLSVLGRTIAESCFRPADVSAFLHCDTAHSLTPADLAAILLSTDGARKAVRDRAYYALLNQCDDAARLVWGTEILRQLGEQGVSAALSCFLPKETQGSGKG